MSKKTNDKKLDRSLGNVITQIDDCCHGYEMSIETRITLTLFCRVQGSHASWKTLKSWKMKKLNSRPGKDLGKKIKMKMSWKNPGHWFQIYIEIRTEYIS